MIVLLNEINFQFSGGSGLGRYAALNFANGAAIKEDNTLNATRSSLGFVGYRHFLNTQLRSNINISGITVNNDTEISGPGVNKLAWSMSVNFLYSPIKPLTFGVELMRAGCELKNGMTGKFDRLQFSAKYNFNFSGTVIN